MDENKDIKDITSNGMPEENIIGYAENEFIADEITEEKLSSALYTTNIPDPDMLIRTGGEKRISNYLLWQVAYAELLFVDEYWPDFGKKELALAIEEFNRRSRRFGK